MPRLNKPASEMPSGALRVHWAIATNTRIEIIRFLLSNPGVSRGEIATATGFSRDTVRPALDELEKTGLLIPSEAQGSRRGRVITYKVDRSALAQDLGALTAYILG